MGCDVVGHTGVLELKAGRGGGEAGGPDQVLKCGLVKRREGSDMREGVDSKGGGGCQRELQHKTDVGVGGVESKLV